MKKIKILTITLLIVAITMIAFVGIYIPEQNRIENKMRDYDFAMDLKGARNIKLKVNTQTKTVIKDANGNEVEDTETQNLTDEQLTEKGYVKEEVPTNSEEVKNLENYKKTQKVIEKRLEKLGVTNYIIKLDELTGDIIIELTENDRTDEVISNLNTAGKFEIVDSTTKEVLMTNSDIKQARVMYGQGSSTGTGTSVYLEIEFNKEGAKKLEEISNQYVTKENTQEDTTTNTTNETTQNAEDVATEENQTDATSETETAQKQITMNIDDQEIMTTSFDEPVRTGKLQLSIGTASTNTETLQGYIDQASNMASVLDSGNMPVKYNVSENQYVLSDITDKEVTMAIYVILAIIVIAMLALLIRFRKLGVAGVISYIGFISLFMIVVRYTNVVISLEGILGIIMALILNYILVNQILSKVNNMKIAYKDFFIKIIPVIIMVVAFSFINWTPISSFGMLMFWGIALMAIYNSIITNSLLKIETRKEK